MSEKRAHRPEHPGYLGTGTGEVLVGERLYRRTSAGEHVNIRAFPDDKKVSPQDKKEKKA